MAIGIGRDRTTETFIDKNTYLPEGKPLTETSMLKSESMLYEPGIFDWAEVDPRRQITTQDREDVVVKVHEAKRNTLVYGFGFEVINRGGSVPSGTVAVPTPKTAPSPPAPSSVTAPTGLAVTAGDMADSLSWKAVTSQLVAGYRVERATSPTGPWTVVAAKSASTAFLDRVPAPATYYYRVAAVTRSGAVSARSAVVANTELALSSVVSTSAVTLRAANGVLTLAFPAGTFPSATRVTVRPAASAPAFTSGVVVTDAFDFDARKVGTLKTVAWDRIGPKDIGVDIGEATRAKFAEVVKGAKTVVWNGPMGVFEIPATAKGTLAIAHALADATALGAITVVGGAVAGSEAAFRELLGQPVAQFAVDASKRSPKHLFFYRPQMVRLAQQDRVVRVERPLRGADHFLLRWLSVDLRLWKAQ